MDTPATPLALAALEARLTDLREQLTDLRDRHMADTQEIARLQGALSAASQQYAELRAQLTGFGDRLGRVESDLGEQKALLQRIAENQERILLNHTSNREAAQLVARFGKWAVIGLAASNGLVQWALSG